MKEEIKKGTRIYYGGDMANEDGFGTVIEIKISKWGTDVVMKMDDGRKLDVPISGFSEEYLGHGGTRFVTQEAYYVWRRLVVNYWV